MLKRLLVLWTSAELSAPWWDLLKVVGSEMVETHVLIMEEVRTHGLVKHAENQF